MSRAESVHCYERSSRSRVNTPSCRRHQRHQYSGTHGTESRWHLRCNVADIRCRGRAENPGLPSISQTARRRQRRSYTRPKDFSHPIHVGRSSQTRRNSLHRLSEVRRCGLHSGWVPSSGIYQDSRHLAFTHIPVGQQSEWLYQGCLRLLMRGGH